VDSSLGGVLAARVVLSLRGARWCDFDLFRHDSSALCAAEAVWLRKRMSAWSRYLHWWPALLHRVQVGLASSHYNDISIAAIAVTVDKGSKNRGLLLLLLVLLLVVVFNVAV